MNTTVLNANTLRRLADLQEQIEGLQSEQAQLMQGLDIQGASAMLPPPPSQARPVYQAQVHTPAVSRSVAPSKTGRHLTPEARQRIADAQKRRWAKRHREAKQNAKRIAEQIPAAPAATTPATPAPAATPAAEPVAAAA